MDSEGGGWRARSRVAALMYASGAVLTALSMLPVPPAVVNRGGIIAVGAVALAAAVVILLLRHRYTIALSHATSVIGTVLVAWVISMAGGTYLSILYVMIYIWVVLFAVFFYGTRAALVHALICSAAVAFGLVKLPPSERSLTWAISTATMLLVVAGYHFMRRHSSRLRGLVEYSGGVVTIVDRDGVVRYQSGLVERVFGYREGALVGAPLPAVVHHDDRDRVIAVLAESAVEPRSSSTLHCRLRHHDGSWRNVEASVENLLGDPAVDGIVLSLRDVTERTRLQDQLTFQAFHDPLTGLANRALFLDRVERRLARMRSSSGPPAVLMLDLDDFKSVNDSMGHSAGDALLVAVAGRLRDCVRGGDTVARLGGDEFAIVLSDCQSEQELSEVADRILAAVRQPVAICDRQVITGASVGAAVATPGEPPEDLLRDADAALYAAKRRGKGRYERFDPRMTGQIARRVQLKSDLRRALDDGELHVLYQPIVNLDSGRTRAFEALLRWRHPSLGLVPPLEFIPLAEETGLILDIGRWVVHEACAQTRRYDDEHAPWEAPAVTVNVSGRQLESAAFVDDVRAALSATGLQPSRLVLEITESVLLQDLAAMAARLESLKRIGVRIAIDDFGTGYSSLSYLHQLPVDLVKIDKSFVNGLVGADPRKRALVEGVIGLIAALGLKSVAEGIENPEQLQRLRALACEHGQGYLFAPPLPAEQLPAWIARSSTPALMPTPA